MRFIADVRKKDIIAGVKGDCNFCPIALALKRAKNVASCRIGGLHIDIETKDGKFYQGFPSQKMLEWIFRYDGSMYPSVKPTRFRIAVHEVARSVYVN